jgi:hypothetical protein
VSVFTRRAGSGFVVVAQDALGLTCEGHWLLTIDVQGGRPVMTILPERFGNYRISHQQKNRNASDQNQRWSKEVFSIAKEPIHGRASSWRVQIDRHVELHDTYQTRAVEFAAA